MGRWDPKLGIYLSNPYAMVGAPDIICVIDGRFVGVEVKTAKGKQSADQVLYMKRLRAHGGAYHVVRSLKDAQAIFD